MKSAWSALFLIALLLGPFGAARGAEYYGVLVHRPASPESVRHGAKVVAPVRAVCSVQRLLVGSRAGGRAAECALGRDRDVDVPPLQFNCSPQSRGSATMFQVQLPKAQAIATGSRASERRYCTAMRASSASAGRRRWMQGRRRFLTLGGHQLSFVLTSLTYFRCSGPPLENAIDVKRSSRLVAVDVALLRPVEMRSAISALYFAPPSLLRAAAIGAENICFSVWRAVLPGHMSELLELLLWRGVSPLWENREGKASRF